jgi:hypothetical protein
MGRMGQTPRPFHSALGKTAPRRASTGTRASPGSRIKERKRKRARSPPLDPHVQSDIEANNSIFPGLTDRHYEPHPASGNRPKPTGCVGFWPSRQTFRLSLYDAKSPVPAFWQNPTSECVQVGSIGLGESSSLGRLAILFTCAEDEPVRSFFLSFLCRLWVGSGCSSRCGEGFFFPFFFLVGLSPFVAFLPWVGACKL